MLVERSWLTAVAWLAALTIGPCALAAGEVTDDAADSDEGLDEDDDLIDEFELLEMEAMVELPARHRQAIGMSPSAVTVFTREDIEATGATSVLDLLRLVPGMDVVITTRFLSAITGRLYWTNENNHYMVLVDGREANLELLGVAPWEVQPISLDDIERIEVIRGPGSSLYGANALAGVVSITTRAVPEKTSAFARITGGEGGVFEAYGRASARLGGWGFSLSGGADLSGRFLDPRTSTKEVWKVRAMAEHRWSEERRLLVEAGAAEGSGSVSAGVGMLDGTLALRTLRLAYESESLRGQLYWAWTPAEVLWDVPLVYNEILLARIASEYVDCHTVDGQVQYTLPTFWDPLLVIVGSGVRSSWLDTEDMLDAETFADEQSTGYLDPGVRHWEVRAGAYLHAELSWAEWITVTGGARYDYNTETGSFASPRLAAVFRPAGGQFVRIGAARAFRKPAFIETRAHPDVDFTQSSLTGGDQVEFRKFMLHVIGNRELEDEELWSFELGYLGQFLDNHLNVALDLYYNMHTNIITFEANPVHNPATGLPDFGESFYRFENTGLDLDIFGWELSLRLNLGRRVQLLTSWAYRQVVSAGSRQSQDESPKHLLTLGGRFSTDFGLLGSLYLFSRSEFWDRAVEDPEGLLAGIGERHMKNVALAIAKLGWRLQLPEGIRAEAGLKLFLPISPSEEPYFRYREKGGWTLPNGRHVGGEELARMISIYLQGSF